MTAKEAWNRNKSLIQLLALVLAAGFTARQYADENYVPQKEAAATHREIMSQVSQTQQQIEGTQKILQEHIRKYELESVKSDIRNVEDQQFQLEQFISINGVNQMTSKRKDELRRRLKDLEEKKNCIINGRPLCE